LRSSAILEQVHAMLRAQVAPFDADRFFAPDIEAARRMVADGALSNACKELFAVLHP
jgi:histidine ammonia-lyase